MKKKTIANLIMVAIILLIAAAGLLGVGHIRGWFDPASEAVAVLTDMRGVINLDRSGVIYPAENDTVLRAEDRLLASSGATAMIRIGDGYIALAGGSRLTVSDPAASTFSASVHSGEIFVHTLDPLCLTLDTQPIVIANATATLSVRSGAQTVSVFRGTVQGAAAGQSVEYISGTSSIAPMQLENLNTFTIDQIRAANQITALCYSNADLDDLAAKRQQALQDLINSMTPTVPEQADPTDPDPTAPSGNDPTEPSAADPTEPSGADPTDPKPTAPTDPDPTEPKPTEPTDTEPAGPTEPEPTTEPDSTAPPATQPVGSCYITIRCDTILNNMETLTAGKAEFVPNDGVILPVVEVPFYEGETVFDVLKRACGIAGIQLEYSWTPLYDSYYIEGINNLYEFDCGNESGWMYKVNEWFPNYGCSSYPLENGDVIVWCYTCKGLGTDVGGPEWMQ